MNSKRGFQVAPIRVVADNFDLIKTFVKMLILMTSNYPAIGKPVFFLVLLLVSIRSQAQLPMAKYSTIFPPGGKTGATVEVTLSGTDLDDASQIYFSNQGITSHPKISEGSTRAEPNKFLVAISSNLPPGIYESRVVGRFGISNARAFVVSDHPEITEPANNQSPSSAAETALGSVVNGHANANAADYFNFQAKKGQRILIECQAKVIDSRMDPVLVLYDSNGHEMDRNRRGGLLDFTSEADGKFTLQVHDFLYRGGDDYYYRLSVGTSPNIDFIFPPAGLAGTKSKFTIYGRNLPGGRPSNYRVHGKPLDELPVELELPGNSAARVDFSPDFMLKPSDAAVDGFEFRLHSTNGISNPVLISFATAPVILEQGTNDSPQSAQKISLPCEFVGQFFPKNDRDWITFEAKKGEVHWVEVFSHRLGLPTDPFAVIQRVTKNEKGEEQVSDVQEMYDLDTNIGGPEFNTATRDLAGRFEAKEAGTYRIEVRDLFNYADSDPRLAYRLSIRNESPDFRLVALPQPPPPINRDKKEAAPSTPFLRKGETISIKLLAYRRDSFNGEIKISVEGLPPGLQAGATTIEPNKTSALLLLTADEKAAGWVGTINILGKAKIGETEIVRAAREGDVVWTIPDYNNEPVQSRIEKGVMLAVSEKEVSPVSISPGENKTWETSLAGKLQIPIKVSRRGEFSDAIKLKAAGLAALDPMKEIDVAGKTNEAALSLDLTQLKIPIGTHTFYLQAQTKGKYRRITADEMKAAEAAAKTADEAAKQAEKESAELASATKKAEETLASTKKAADEAEAKAKSISEKLASAKTAAEKSSASEELATARATAEKEATEASDRARSAKDAKAAAEKNFKEASAKAKDAEGKKSHAAQVAKDAKQLLEKGQLKDLTVTAYSSPISLKVVPAPINLSANPSANRIAQGTKIEIPVKVERLFGFNDAVELSLSFPKDAGLTSAKATLGKDQNQTKLLVEANPNAKPGEHKFNLLASLKLNGQDLKVEQPIILKIEAAEKPKS